MIDRTTLLLRALLGAAVAGQACSACAELVLSQLVVDLPAGKAASGDVEVWNSSPERAYVAVEPSEIADPGLGTERRLKEPDPGKLGILVSPARLILEPGQRRLVRIAAVAPAASRERVYRVTVKPVAGELDSSRSGLKILVGYDLLVLVRPTEPNPKLTASRDGNQMTIRNEGNVSVELTDGRQCENDGKACAALPGKRLYPGASWSQQLASPAAVDYLVKSPAGSVRNRF